MKKRIAILTSGGDCAGLNAAIRAAVHRADLLGWEIYGILDGTAGLLCDPLQYRVLTPAMFDNNVMRMGGTVLGTTNKGNPFAFPMPDGQAIEADCEVVWAQHSGPYAGEFGLRFVDIARLDEERIREGGCEAYLSKPISVGKFIETGYRRFRKYNGAAIVITQSLADLYANPVGEAIAAVVTTPTGNRSGTKVVRPNLHNYEITEFLRDSQ